MAYRGKSVLRRAHVPILSVRYRNDFCGPYRDWQWQENMFKATGDNVAPASGLCPSKVETVLESVQDQGNFRGVAIYVDGEEVVLVSELEAGWYRYISRWRLHADPWGFGDLWALRHRPGQIDDGVGFTSDPALARAHLNRSGTAGRSATPTSCSGTRPTSPTT